MKNSRSVFTTSILLTLIILLVVVPIVFGVKIKSFNNTVDAKNKTIKEQQININTLRTQVETLETEKDTLQEDYEILKKKYQKMSEERESEETTEATIEPVKEEELHQYQPEPTTEYEEPTTQAATTEEVTTEATEAYTEEETTEVMKAEEVESKDDNGLKYSETYNVTDAHLTRSNGVVYYNNHKETWYSTNEAAGKATAWEIPGKHVADDGTIRDADGYVCVASSDHSHGTVIQTSVGPGKVYDCGCSHGTVDIYTNW